MTPCSFTACLHQPPAATPSTWRMGRGWRSLHEQQQFSTCPGFVVLPAQQLLLLGRYQGNPSSPGCYGDAEAATMAKKSPVDKCQKKSSNRLKAISRAVEPPWACHLPLFIYHGKGFGQNTQSREIVDMWGPSRANPSSSSPFPRHTN